MSQESKIRTIGACKSQQPLTVETLVKFAERVILTDKNAALRAQNAVSDLTAITNDSRTPLRVSALDELCGKSGAVRVKDHEANDLKDPKVIQFSKQRKGS